MTEIILLGYGNLNSRLLDVFHRKENIRIKQVFNRNQIKIPGPFRDIPFTDDLHAIEKADIYIIGISDDAIAPFSESLPFKNRLVVHTSGGVSMDALSSKNRRGVFYPLQTFTKNRHLDFDTIPICLESEYEEDMEILNFLGRSISGHVESITSGQRATLHVAAVFVNNFVNACYQMGSAVLENENLSFDLLKPLILETAMKIQEIPPKEAQTGPAKRKDKKTIEKHMKLLQGSSYQKYYEILTGFLMNDPDSN